MAEPNPVRSGSGSPNGKSRPKRLSDEHMVTRLTRAIAREKVEYTEDGTTFFDKKVSAVYTRIERIIRVLFGMAEKGNIGAVRLLAEIAEGKLARQVGEIAKNDEGVKLTDEQMAALIEIALARLEEWHEDMQREEAAQEPAA